MPSSYWGRTERKAAKPKAVEPVAAEEPKAEEAVVAVAMEMKVEELAVAVEPIAEEDPIVVEAAGITTFTCKECGRIFPSPNRERVIYCAKRHARQTGHKN